MFDVPRAFALWLRLVPLTLHEHLFALSMNHFLRGQPLASRLPELHGKRFRLCADDVPIALTFEISAGRVVRSSLQPDVTFRGITSDLIALAKGCEDPDTLFFQRRLSIEGETETGVHLKNLLDGWEYDMAAHLRALLPAPLAHAALGVRAAMRGLHELSRVRRPSSRRNNRPEESSRGS